ncbi:hypothetical protein, partial [Plasmodium yoelii yoelii]
PFGLHILTFKLDFVIKHTGIVHIFN